MNYRSRVVWRENSSALLISELITYGATRDLTLNLVQTIEIRAKKRQIEGKPSRARAIPAIAILSQFCARCYPRIVAQNRHLYVIKFSNLRVILSET